MVCCPRSGTVVTESTAGVLLCKLSLVVQRALWRRLTHHRCMLPIHLRPASRVSTAQVVKAAKAADTKAEGLRLLDFRSASSVCDVVILLWVGMLGMYSTAFAGLTFRNMDFKLSLAFCLTWREDLESADSSDSALIACALTLCL